MTNVAPVKANKKRLHLLTQEQFFRDVAEEAGFIERDLVKLVYNAMLVVLYRELKTKGAVRFPALCDFYMKLMNGKYYNLKYQGGPRFKPPWHKLVIKPTQRVRNYFNSYQEKHPDKLFDPDKRIERGGDVTVL